MEDFMKMGEYSIEKHHKWINWKKALVAKLTAEQYEEFAMTWPSVVWCPTIGQERFFDIWFQEKLPKITLVTYGNGSGKTAMLAEFLCGIMKGPDYVNPIFCNCPIFHELSEKREKGTLSVWWIADADLLKKGGTDIKEIKAHIPDAIFKGMDSKSVYHELIVPTVSKSGKQVENTVQFKTHGQDAGSYAGQTLDIAIGDEPPPPAVWGELIGRTRSKKGEVGARIILGATPLNVSGYLQDAVESPETAKLMVHLKGSTWQNVHDDDIPEEEAVKRGFPKDRNGKFYTRGHLTRESIEAQIAFWRKSSDPSEVLARLEGEFGNFLGKIYKNFSREVHVVKDFPIPKEWPILQYIDPHDSRDDCVVYVAVSPQDKLYVIAEDPKEPYEQLFSRSGTIEQAIERWLDFERTMGWMVLKRYGDPNKFLDPDPYTGKRLYELYSKHGIKVNTQITDNLAMGHSEVMKLLHYDRDKFSADKEDPAGHPSIFFFESCVNCINFMSKYTSTVPKDLSSAFKETVDQHWKDFPDLVRYAAMTKKPYSHWQEIKSSGRFSEWGSIKKKRSPQSDKKETFKGRRVVSAKVFK
jgi:hypothetical protein